MHPWAAGQHKMAEQAQKQGVNVPPQHRPQLPLPVLMHVGVREEYLMVSYGAPYWEQMFCRALMRAIHSSNLEGRPSTSRRKTSRSDFVLQLLGGTRRMDVRRLCEPKLQ